LVKCDRLLHIIHLNGDVVASINFHAHTNIRLWKGASRDLLQPSLCFRSLPAQPDSERHESEPQSTRGRWMSLKGSSRVLIEFGSAIPKGRVSFWLKQVQHTVTNQDHSNQFFPSRLHKTSMAQPPTPATQIQRRQT
jgi:hypothetical protein